MELENLPCSSLHISVGVSPLKASGREAVEARPAEWTKPKLDLEGTFSYPNSVGHLEKKIWPVLGKVAQVGEGYLPVGPSPSLDHVSGFTAQCLLDLVP